MRNWGESGITWRSFNLVWYLLDVLTYAYTCWRPLRTMYSCTFYRHLILPFLTSGRRVNNALYLLTWISRAICTPSSLFIDLFWIYRNSIIIHFPNFTCTREINMGCLHTCIFCQHRRDVTAKSFILAFLAIATSQAATSAAHIATRRAVTAHNVLVPRTLAAVGFCNCVVKYTVKVD